MSDLIIYFSHTGENYMNDGIKNIDKGNTEIVAEYIKEYTNGILLKVEPLNDYPYNYKECCNKAKLELDENERPKLKKYIKSIREYNTIYVGGPVWYGTYPMPIFSILDSLDLNGVTIKPFTTHEGSGLGNVIRDLKRLYPESLISDGLDIRGSSAINARERIEKWCDK